jgi:hypothetical protein
LSRIHKSDSLPNFGVNTCPGTAPPTPCRCATLCGMISNHLAALYHLLPYGRRTAPSKKDGGTLEGKTYDYSTHARDDTVTSVQWERSPSSPSALCDHPRHRDAISATASPYPMLWKHAATGRRHASHCALCGCLLHGTVGHASNEQPLRHPPRGHSWTRTGHATMPLPEAGFARMAVYSTALYAMPPHVTRTVWHACKLLPPWPIKGGAVP